MKFSDAFLARVTGEPNSQVFLKNGVRLNGTISLVDRDAMALTYNGATQLIFMDAIATVMSAEPLTMFDIMGNE